MRNVQLYWNILSEYFLLGNYTEEEKGEFEFEFLSD